MHRSTCLFFSTLLLLGACAHSPEAPRDGAGAAADDPTAADRAAAADRAVAAASPTGVGASEGAAPAAPPPPAEAPEALRALAGSWEGTWSDGAPSTLAVLELNAEYATVLLTTGSHTDPKHRPWRVRVRARVLPDGAPGIGWGEGTEPRFTFTLSPEGEKLEGRFQEGDTQQKVTMTRRTAPIDTTGLPDPRFVCPAFAKTLAQIEAEKTPAARKARVDALIAQARSSHTPLKEPYVRPGHGCATFLYRGEAREVAIAGDMNGWNTRADYLRRVDGTDLFFLSREVPQSASLEYKLLPDGRWTLDPLNPATMVGGYGPNSHFHMSHYVPPPEVERYPDIPHGTLEKVSIDSRTLKNGRKLTVYLPPGYASSTERHRVLYVLDGQDAVDFAKIDNILDYLIHHRRLPPTIAVMAPPVQRQVEYAMNPAFEAFFVKELIPMIDARYRTRPEAAGRMVAGISMGGVAALSLALRHTEVFGGAIAQSSGGPDETFFALKALIAKEPKRPGRFYMDVGRYEADLHGSDLLNFSRQLYKAHHARHYFKYVEINEGHSWGSWRSRLDDGLEYVWQ